MDSVSAARPPGARPVPPALVEGARLRREGNLAEAERTVEAALRTARATPYDTPFRDRVLLGLTLADLYVSTDRKSAAQDLLTAEAGYAAEILAIARQSADPDTVLAADVGHRQLRDRAVQIGLLGAPAPPIDVLHWVGAEPTTLAALRGRVVLLEFWSVTCRSCVSMFPVLADLDARYRGRGLTILGLTRYTVDDPAGQQAERGQIGAALTAASLPIGVGIAPDGRLQTSYGASGIPTFALIDRDGIVQLATSIPDKAKIEKMIEELLGT